MATYDLRFYSYDPTSGFATNVGGTTTYAGPTQFDSAGTFTDNQSGIEGQYLDDNESGENATATMNVGGTSYSNVAVHIEEVLQVRDTVTGQIFKIARLEWNSGGTTHHALLSETKMVAGRSYVTVSNNTTPDSGNGEDDLGFNYADFSDSLIEGTSGNDTIDASYTGDPHGDRVDGVDSYQDSVTASSIHWRDFGSNNADLRGGVSTTINGVDVSIGYSDDGAGEEFSVASETQYRENGENIPNNSASYLYGNGTGNSATVTVDFAAAAGMGRADEVNNVLFRMNDIDGNPFQDRVTIRAYDADGNEVEVRFFIEGNDSVTGNTIIGSNNLDDPNQSDGSVLVEIPGPVARIVIDYDNGGAATHGVYITDITFDAVTPSNADDINAGAGNDYVDAGLGNDSVLGGDGNDTLYGGAGSDTLLGQDGADQIFGEAGNDYIDGGAGNDTLSGGDGNDTILGGDGADLISSGAGNDSIDAGAGNDTVLGSAGADTINTASGMDYVDYSASSQAVNINLGTGSASGGDAQGDVLSGVDGLVGSGFNDTLIGFDGEQVGGADAYTNDLRGGGGNDYIEGRGGSDSLYGDAGNDTVLGGDGNDHIEGGIGTDSLSGEAGNDTILGGAGNDTISGGDGADSIDGGANDDLITGGAGNDTLLGGAGNDDISGGAGADQLDGGDGDDTVRVGSGDTAIGGAGDDLFIIDPAALTGGTITIDGFETSETGGDSLDFNGQLSGPVTYTAQGAQPGGRAGYATLIDGTIVNFSNIERIICFARGTQIYTPRGPIAVEALAKDDMVLTRDNGMRPIRWINSRSVPGRGVYAPIRFEAGVMNNERALIVSPQHRMLIKGHRPELLFGQREVLAAAKHLVNGTTIRQVESDMVEYFHIMFDSHELIFADGAISESFHPGDQSLMGLTDPAREELFALFPELRTLPSSHGQTARLCLRKHEAALLAA